MLYRITTNYACFAIITKDNLVIKAPPIAKWTVGKNIDSILNYYKNKKNADIKEIGENNA